MDKQLDSFEQIKAPDLSDDGLDEFLDINVGDIGLGLLGGTGITNEAFDDNRESSAQSLIKLLKQTAINLRTLHRNLSGGNWFTIHELLGDWYEQIDKFEDSIVENLLSLGVEDVPVTNTLDARDFSEEEALHFVQNSLKDIKLASEKTRQELNIPTAVAPAFDELEQFCQIEGEYKLAHYFKSNEAEQDIADDEEDEMSDLELGEALFAAIHKKKCESMQEAKNNSLPKLHLQEAPAKIKLKNLSLSKAGLMIVDREGNPQTDGLLTSTKDGLNQLKSSSQENQDKELILIGVCGDKHVELMPAKNGNFLYNNQFLKSRVKEFNSLVKSIKNTTEMGDVDIYDPTRKMVKKEQELHKTLDELASELGQKFKLAERNPSKVDIEDLKSSTEAFEQKIEEYEEKYGLGSKFFDEQAKQPSDIGYLNDYKDLIIKINDQIGKESTKSTRSTIKTQLSSWKQVLKLYKIKDLLRKNRENMSLDDNDQINKWKDLIKKATDAVEDEQSNSKELAEIESELKTCWSNTKPIIQQLINNNKQNNGDEQGEDMNEEENKTTTVAPQVSESEVKEATKETKSLLNVLLDHVKDLTSLTKIRQNLIDKNMSPKEDSGYQSLRDNIATDLAKDLGGRHQPAFLRGLVGSMALYMAKHEPSDTGVKTESFEPDKQKELIKEAFIYLNKKFYFEK